jgi:hypothetical protein
VIVDAVTQRYAERALAPGAGEGRAAAVVAPTSSAREVARAIRACARAIVESAPRARERKRARDRRRGSAHALVQNLVDLLFDKRSRGRAPSDRRGVPRAPLEAAGNRRRRRERASARTAEMALIATQLGRSSASSSCSRTAIVPELVGGARVIARNRMIDYSVQGRLEPCADA